ncbi:MAG TPA: hypothetical protein VFD58_12050 [Blastocatellia bacterium]|nr:hypothetical protein [Blastocatellia bacterium]
MKTRTIVLMFVTLLVIPALSSAQQTRNSIHVENDNWTWQWSENGRGLEVKIRGRAGFTEDYSDVTSLSPGGHLRVRDTRTSATRKIEIEPDSGGLKRSYSVDGRAHEFDNEARQWLAGVLIEMVRQGGYDAPGRVERLFKQGGANAVLDEVTRIRSDYVKRIYLENLLKDHRLDSASVQRVVRQTAREISSDYEKRQVLARVAEQFLDDKALISDFIAAAATVKSDYERGQILSALLRQNLSEDQMKGALRAITGISSDYEKAKLLVQMVESRADHAVAPAPFFDAVNTISSDYEHSRVLLALLRQGKPGADALKLTVKSASLISSDYEKARVLMQVAAVGKGDEGVRNALVEAAKTINSDYERGRVFSAAFR